MWLKSKTLLGRLWLCPSRQQVSVLRQIIVWDETKHADTGSGCFLLSSRLPRIVVPSKKKKKKRLTLTERCPDACNKLMHPTSASFAWYESDGNQEVERQSSSVCRTKRLRQVVASVVVSLVIRVTSIQSYYLPLFRESESHGN